jgi:hypothetical protein
MIRTLRPETRDKKGAYRVGGWGGGGERPEGKKPLEGLGRD